MEQEELERLVGGPLRLTYEEILHHPRFAQARAVYLGRFLAVYGGDPFLVRLLIEAGRFLVFHSIASLHFTQDPARRETWLTIGLLKESLTLFGMASGRQIDHLIARLAAVDFVRIERSAADRRVRIVTPTERLLAHHRQWLAAHYAPLAVLYPQHDYPAMRLCPVFHELYLRDGVPFRPVTARLMATLPGEMFYFSHIGGTVIIAALVEMACRGGSSSAALSYGDVGDRFGVSRTHVRNLLEAAEAQGLLKLHGRGGQQVELLPAQWDSFNRGMSLGMYLHDAVSVMIMREYAKRKAAIEL